MSDLADDSIKFVTKIGIYFQSITIIEKKL